MNRYQYIQIEKDPTTKVRYYRDNKYPTIPLSDTDKYVVTSTGDRYDLLATQYYRDQTLWWIISMANSLLPQNSIFIPIGTQLRIPLDINGILKSYNNLNS